MTYERIVPVTGGSTSPGKAYHAIPGVDGPAHRNDTEARIAHIVNHYDPAGKIGCDIGCSVGGISIGLAEHGAQMRGYDWDRQAIHVARSIRTSRRLSCTFTVADLTTPDPWEDLESTAPDFVVWMSNWMWVAELAGGEFARDRIQFISQRVPTLIFETAEGGVSMAGSAGIRSADDVEAMLTDLTGYTVTNLGPPAGDSWHSRSVFLCT